MPNDFKQTVNLREKFEQDRAQMIAPAKKPLAAEGAKARAEAIDQVYRNGDSAARPDLKKISRPQFRQWDERFIRRVITIAVIILVGVLVIWLIARNHKPADTTVSAPKWYMVTLVSGEAYYGQIVDEKVNPVEITNVYYDYDQQAGKTDVATGTGNIRLVKKGKESYGPSGKMLIYQAQIKGIDELRDDSKVLQAILEYEKKK